MKTMKVVDESNGYRTVRTLTVDKVGHALLIERHEENLREPLLSTMPTILVLHINDQIIKEGLRELGWLPPYDAQKMREELDEVAETAEFYRKELYEKGVQADGKKT